MNALRVAVLFCIFASAASFAQETNLLPTKVTVDGVAYEEVRWGTVTPSVVSIFHKSGVASFPLEKLPPELQKQFGYDPKKAAEYRANEAELEQRRQQEVALQKQQGALQKLRAQNLRKIGNKLYDFAVVRQLLTQFEKVSIIDQPNEWDALYERVKKSGDLWVLGSVSAVQGDLLLIKDGRFEDYVYVENYPGARILLEGQGVSAAALWVDNRDGKRVYDCGTLPTDDELVSLPVEQIKVK